MSETRPRESEQAPRPRRVPTLLVKGMALLLISLGSVFAVFSLVPDGNDYAEATLLKHRRLEETSGRRIVLVGGSNLAFGVDSSVLERKTGCSVVNMGMNGYLGLSYMLAEVRPFLRESDIVVISLEYDNFFKSPEGAAVDQLMIVKANPAALSFLTWHQRWNLLGAIPYVAQQKVLRLMRETLDRAWMRLFDLAPAARTTEVNDIETLVGFTERGDLTSHLGVDWEWEREDGVDMTNTPRNEEVIPLLQEFSRQMQAHKINVLLSHTSVMRDYYMRHQRTIDRLHDQMAHSTPLKVPSPPSAFVYDDELFFDTVYHLNADGRRQRSERLANDIIRQLDQDASCPTTAFAAKTEVNKND